MTFTSVSKADFLREPVTFFRMAGPDHIVSVLDEAHRTVASIGGSLGEDVELAQHAARTAAIAQRLALRVQELERQLAHADGFAAGSDEDED